MTDDAIDHQELLVKGVVSSLSQPEFPAVRC